jgi:hypothetical protein
MSQFKSISEVLANLILQHNVPLKAIAIAGEAIATDAPLLDYPHGAAKRTTGPELYQFLETYDALLRHSEVVVREFLETRDAHALIRDLSGIKQALVELY